MPRLAVACALVLAIVAGVASASVLVAESTPVADEFASERYAPDPAAESRISAITEDPAGGSPYALRIYETREGLTCAELGRTDGGRFGRVDPDGTFVELPAAPAGSCSDLGQDPFLLSRRLSGVNTNVAMDVLYGVAPVDKQVRVNTPDRTMATQTDDGAFIVLRADGEFVGGSIEIGDVRVDLDAGSP